MYSFTLCNVAYDVCVMLRAAFLSAQHQSPLVFWSLSSARQSFFLFHRLCCVLYGFVSFYILCSVVFTSYLFKNVHSHYACFFFFFFVLVVSHVCKRKESYVVDVSMFLWAYGLLLRPAEECSVLKLFEVVSFNAL